MWDFKYILLIAFCAFVIMVLIQTTLITMRICKLDGDITNPIKLYFSILSPPVGDSLISKIVLPIRYYIAVSSGYVLSSFKYKSNRSVHALKLKIEDTDNLELNIRVVSELMLPIIVDEIVTKTMDVDLYNGVVAKVLDDLKNAQVTKDYTNDLLLTVKVYSETINADVSDVIRILIAHLPALDSSVVKSIIELKKA